MAAAIRGFVGLNGGGKTLAVVELAVLPAVAEGRVIVANFRLDVPDFKLLRSWRELIRLGAHHDEITGEPKHLGRRGQPIVPGDPDYDGAPLYSLTNNRPSLLVLDEITAALPSRSAMSMPSQLQRILNQLRKHDVLLAWSAPNWARADLILREVTQEVTDCRGYAADYWRREVKRSLWPKRLRDDAGQPIREEGAWRPKRLFHWRTYDAVDFEEFSLDVTMRIKPIASRWYWRPVHLAHEIYRTMATVELLDHLDDLGTCVNCGGRRSQPRCSCPAAHDDNSSVPTPAPARDGDETRRRRNWAATNGSNR